MAPDRLVGRRLVLGGLVASGATLTLAACGDAKSWHDLDVTGTSPALEFSLRRAPDGRAVTEADYRGDIAMLYFGYTFCPDVCPLTLQNAGTVFDRMGPDASGAVRLLFVTVDPGRDTLPVLGKYVSLFGSNIVGLRGTDDQLARLARRYRIAYSVTPSASGKDEDVTHSSAIYVFDRTGAARLLIPSLATSAPDIAGVSADLTRLVNEAPRDRGWLARFV